MRSLLFIPLWQLVDARSFLPQTQVAPDSAAIEEHPVVTIDSEGSTAGVTPNALSGAVAEEFDSAVAPDGGTNATGVDVASSAEAGGSEIVVTTKDGKTTITTKSNPSNTTSAVEAAANATGQDQQITVTTHDGETTITARRARPANVSAGDTDISQVSNATAPGVADTAVESQPEIIVAVKDGKTTVTARSAASAGSSIVVQYAVISPIANMDARRAIRSTWGSWGEKMLGGVKTSLKFFVGGAGGSADELAALNDEASAKGDVVVWTEQEDPSTIFYAMNSTPDLLVIQTDEMLPNWERLASFVNEPSPWGRERELPLLLPRATVDAVVSYLGHSPVAEAATRPTVADSIASAAQKLLIASGVKTKTLPDCASPCDGKSACPFVPTGSVPEVDSGCAIRVVAMRIAGGAPTLCGPLDGSTEGSCAQLELGPVVEDWADFQQDLKDSVLVAIVVLGLLLVAVALSQTWDAQKNSRRRTRHVDQLLRAS
mmetsp:Transcript_45407/g.98534  ORF Transcript_45407/g.98534 Transcript_45407/m.98534 type:complete len:489 (-) Transcript_45407:158-1624(-)|eukprot:CAMPEP_0204273294 /NCGR_PEP_ID=MMETSP0468-20130131/23003_1 /ASSEMBLY_ACC=CAM_ASM_000383 /TAXON_ID=2969 /ORGANISM="Oxyrrhis marina" /LENGTH=488 /DNA_ID=CAMNT_0051249283 /DNA_START=225 /DNA_END=1691 /DNA_ORIENTATION=+